MSIQTKTKMINGKKTTYYYPVVSTYKIDKSKTPIWGEGFLKKSDAELEEARMLVSLHENNSIMDREKKTILFKTVREAWLQTRSVKVTSTQDRDTDYCNLYLSILDDTPISQINGEDIQNWVTLLAKKYAPKTVRLALNLLSQVMDYAVSPLKIIKENPCKGNIQKPVLRKRGVTRDLYWTERELKYFINHPYTQQDSYYRMFLIHSSFGMRPGEVCGLSVYDYDEDTGLVSINYGLGKKRQLTDLKTTGAQRTLAVPERLRNIFIEQIILSNRLRPKNAKYPFLFILEDGREIIPDTYCQHLQRLIERINNDSPSMYIKPITPYGLRHTFATVSLLKGQHPKAVAEVMGDSIETMMTNYVHIIEKMVGNTLEIMAETILGDEDGDQQNQN